MKSYAACGSLFAFASTALAITLGVSERNAGAQPPAAPATQKKDELLEEMTQVVRSLKLAAIGEQGKETPATLSEEPAHRWTDPTRTFSVGALWVWKAGGRPVAVVGAELYAQWSLEFVSVTPGLVRADDDDNRVRWRPRKGVEFREIPDAPAVATTEAGRFRQMRDLARQFARAILRRRQRAALCPPPAPPTRSTITPFPPPGSWMAGCSSVPTGPIPSCSS